MSELAEFLAARYVDARARENGKRRSIPSPFDGHEVEILYSPDEGEVVLVNGRPYPADKYWAMATEPAPDPEVLADLDSKQQILAYAMRRVSCSDAHPQHDMYHPDGHVDMALLRLLALAYADHPEYRQEWTP